jgi:uncharacterized membrane protein YidH (DUF202 family)
MSELFDPGLQPERTELAWRRTALALAVGSLVAVRLVPVALGDPWWAFVGVAGLVLAAAVWVGARLRAHAVQRALRGSDRAPLPDALPLLLFALAVAAAGALALGVVLLAGFGR